MIFYSASTGGFYTDVIHGNAMPADAVEITADEHHALLDGQSLGKRIVAGQDGRPQLMEPVLTDADLAAQARQARAPLLLAADNAINRIEDNAGDASAWRKYRQALRDVPAQKGFPQALKWPLVPA